MASFRNYVPFMAAVGVGAIAVRALLRPEYDLRGKNVLITGGSRGLGLELARQFAQAGARIAICSRHQDQLDRAADDLKRCGTDLFWAVCDVTDRSQVEDFINRLGDELGEVDVLVNNAGVIQAGPQEEMTLKDYEDAMKTHLFGPLHMIEAVLPQMRKHQEGRIVNIASIGGLISVPHLLPYSTSKFALVGYSLGLRSELAKDGIVVTTICPGLMRTGSPRNALFKGQHRAEYTWFKISDSLPVVSICSERAAYQVLRACQKGDGLVVLGLPSKIAATIHALAPGMVSNCLGLVNRLLPGPGGIGQRQVRGHQSETVLSESFITGLTQEAAIRNNEM